MTVTWCLVGVCVPTTQQEITVRSVPRSTTIDPGGLPTAAVGRPTHARSVSVTATQIAVTSLSGHGFPLAESVGVFVRTASITPPGVGAIAVATATTAAHPYPSAPPTHAYAAGVILGDLFLLYLERKDPGATLGVASATVNLV